MDPVYHLEPFFFFLQFAKQQQGNGVGKIFTSDFGAQVLMLDDRTNQSGLV